MKLPNGSIARVDETKIRDYLLSKSHTVGSHKSVFFEVLGYSFQDWRRLKTDLLELAKLQTALPTRHNGYGQMYVVDGRLVGPAGKAARIRTVWIVPDGEDAPRFVTAYPGGAK